MIKEVNEKESKLTKNAKDASTICNMYHYFFSYYWGKNNYHTNDYGSNM